MSCSVVVRVRVPIETSYRTNVPSFSLGRFQPRTSVPLLGLLRTTRLPGESATAQLNWTRFDRTAGPLPTRFTA